MAAGDAITLFAPAERHSNEEIQREARDVLTAAALQGAFDACPFPIAVLNDSRQIVLCNDALRGTAGASRKDEVIGKRPGELLNCVRLKEAPNGCGTAEACSTCGAVLSILEALEGKACRKECRLTCGTDRRQECFDFDVHSSPLQVHGERYAIVCLADISHEKRRRALEAIFFHDVMNTAGGIQGLAEVIGEFLSGGEGAELATMLRGSAEELLRAIQEQRQLASAERGELVPRPSKVGVLDLIRSVTDRYRVHPVARDRSIEIDEGSARPVITTDEGLLDRVISNMLKNALEAAAVGETVLLGCDRPDNEHVAIWVRNRAVMRREIQLQMFQRSFSTKGAGRGLGTYSIKLLTERYLGGRVSFSSDPDEGTTFRAVYPVDFPPG